MFNIEFPPPQLLDSPPKYHDKTKMIFFVVLLFFGQHFKGHDKRHEKNPA